MKFLHRRGHSLNHLDGNSATSSPAPSVISLSSTVNETSKYPVTEVPACVQLPWHAVFPAPRSTPAYATAADLASMVRNLTAGKDYVIVDVRRADFEVFASCRIFAVHLSSNLSASRTLSSKAQ
ncbi:hypothetical protein FRC02_008915 [Tulasnella sp. 418]|nr:hypothetical protein FRC02_008915 [Tulasnella sp. 418]